jgi:hypothetical protein
MKSLFWQKDYSPFKQSKHFDMMSPKFKVLLDKIWT